MAGRAIDRELKEIKRRLKAVEEENSLLKEKMSEMDKAAAEREKAFSDAINVLRKDLELLRSQQGSPVPMPQAKSKGTIGVEEEKEVKKEPEEELSLEHPSTEEEMGEEEREEDKRQKKERKEERKREKATKKEKERKSSERKPQRKDGERESRREADTSVAPENAGGRKRGIKTAVGSAKKAKTMQEGDLTTLMKDVELKSEENEDDDGTKEQETPEATVEVTEDGGGTGKEREAMVDAVPPDTIQRCISSLVHACTCRDPNCRRMSCHKMKRVVQHTKVCVQRRNGTCPVCSQLIALCCYHAKNCTRDACQVPFCMYIHGNLEGQEAAAAQI